MNKRTTTTAITVLLGAGIVALASGFVRPNQDTTTASQRAVLNANNKFFEALNAMFKGDTVGPAAGASG